MANNKKCGIKRIFSAMMATGMTLTAFSVMRMKVNAEYELYTSAQVVKNTATVNDKVSSGDYIYEVLDDGTIEIKDYTGFTETLDIPYSIDGYVVSVIGYGAFDKCSSLKSITIPDSVTTIERRAFAECVKLTNITIGSSVKTIGPASFYDCKKLESITIPDSVITIEDGAFDSCTGLTNVIIGNGVTTICDKAFNNCCSLASIKMGSSVTTIGDSAFADCTSLTDIMLSNSVKSIGKSAMLRCISLTTVMVPSSVTSIGDLAFLRCDNLKNIIVDEDNRYYKSIDGVLFNKDATKLICYSSGRTDRFYVIPNSVTTIVGHAFENNDNIKKVTISNGVKEIWNAAFFDCSELISVTIPNSVTEIKPVVFDRCNDLTDIYYTGNKEEWSKMNIGTNDNIKKVTIHYNSKNISISDYLMILDDDSQIMELWDIAVDAIKYVLYN